MANTMEELERIRQIIVDLEQKLMQPPQVTMNAEKQVVEVSISDLIALRNWMFPQIGDTDKLHPGHFITKYLRPEFTNEP